MNKQIDETTKMSYDCIKQLQSIAAWHWSVKYTRYQS